MTSVLARCCRRRALGLWAGGHGTLGGPNPSRGSLVSTQTGAAYSTAAVSEPAPLGGAQPAVAVAPPTPAQQQRQQADGSQHAASQASIPVQQGTSSSAAVASSAAPAAAAGQPCTAAAAEAGAPGAAPGVAAGEPGLLARMRAAQAHGRHQLATDIFMDAGMGWGLPPAEQRAAFEAALLSCTFTRNGSRALHLARAMWKRGVPVGPAAHLSVVHAAAAGNRHREAYDYLRSIARRHLRARMFNALLTAAVGRGDAKMGERVVELMQRRGIQPDAVTYTAVIELRGQQGNLGAVEAEWQRAAAAVTEEAHPMLHAARVIALARAGALDAAIDAAAGFMDAYPDLLPVDISPPSPLHFPRHSAAAAAAAGGEQQQQQQQAGQDAAPAAAGPDGVQGWAVADGAPQQQQQQEQQQGEPMGSTRSRRITPLQYLRGACDAVLKQAEKAGDQAASKRLMGLTTLRGLPPSTTTYNTLLHAAARRAPDPAAALQAVEDGMREMELLGLEPNLVTYELLIRARARAGDVAGVRRAVGDLQAAGLRPTEATWASVMRAYAAAGELEAVSEAFEQLHSTAPWPRVETYIAAFNAVCAWGESEAAQRPLSDELNATVTNLRLYQRQLAAALLQRWVGEMEDLGIRHSAASFVALIQALGYTGQPELVVQLMRRAFEQPVAAASASSAAGKERPAPAAVAASVGREARRQQPSAEPSSRTKEAAAEGAAAVESSSSSDGGGSGAAAAEELPEQAQQHEQWQEPHGPQQAQQASDGGQAAQQEPVERSVAPGRLRPDPRYFVAAISSCARLARLDDAVAMLRLMRACGLEPGAHVYTSVIACCAYLRMPGLARTLFGEMRGRGVEPNLFTYNALLKVECHCGSLDAALQLLQDMEHQGVRPDAVSWRTLLSAAKYLGRSEVADLARQKLLGTPGDAEARPEEAGEAEAAPAGEQAQQQQQGWQGYYESDGEDEDEW